MLLDSFSLCSNMKTPGTLLHRSVSNSAPCPQQQNGEGFSVLRTHHVVDADAVPALHDGQEGDEGGDDPAAADHHGHSHGRHLVAVDQRLAADGVVPANARRARERAGIRWVEGSSMSSRSSSSQRHCEAPPARRYLIGVIGLCVVPIQSPEAIYLNGQSSHTGRLEMDGGVWNKQQTPPPPTPNPSQQLRRSSWLRRTTNTTDTAGKSQGGGSISPEEALKVRSQPTADRWAWRGGGGAVGVAVGQTGRV